MGPYIQRGDALDESCLVNTTSDVMGMLSHDRGHKGAVRGRTSHEMGPGYK